ncbi:MAG: ATP-binding protein [Myxococcota bacterium]
MYTRMLQVLPQHRKSFFLFGPRATGKTLWVKQAFPRGLYLDLLQADLHRELLARPEQLEQLIPPRFNNWVIIDEVQRVPALLSQIHRLIENRRLRFVLTGSSARSLRKRGANLLAGRALTRMMYPLTAYELGKDFDIKKSIAYGHLPALTHEPDPHAYLQSYVGTYMQQEVLQEGVTRQLDAFTRFLQVASFCQGQVVNLTEIARECSMHRKTVANYFCVLEDLLVGYRLPPFTRRAKRQVVMHAKFYFFDVGIYRALRPKGVLDSPPEQEGAALETLVWQELRAVNDTLELGYSLHYWRTRTGQEVDFVLYGPRGLLAIEVKRHNQVHSADLRGLRAFVNAYPEATPILLYGGQRRRYQGGVAILPIQQTLLQLPQLLQDPASVTT